MQSLRLSLAKLGMKPPFSVRSNLQTYPESLSELMKIMNLPNPDFAKLQYKRIFDFTEENAQGVTYSYEDNWMLSSEGNIFKYKIEGANLYVPTNVTRLKAASLQNLLKLTAMDETEFNHIGDIDYYNGLVFAPIKCTSGDAHVVLALSGDLELVGYSRLAMSTGDSWCTVNPWTRQLWMPNRQSTHYLDVYDVSDFYTLLQRRGQWGAAAQAKLLSNRRFSFFKEDGTPDYVESIQGIAFSRNGRLYVARYNGDGPWENYMHIFNALTGTRIAVSPEYNFPGTYDEIEGLSIHPSGIIYVAVADNDIIGDDEFELYAFRYTDPSFPL